MYVLKACTGFYANPYLTLSLLFLFQFRKACRIRSLMDFEENGIIMRSAD